MLTSNGLNYFAAPEYLSGSPFGTNHQLPLVGLSCNSGATNIGECQFYNQTNTCNHERTVGVFCNGKDYCTAFLNYMQYIPSYSYRSHVRVRQD